MKIYSNCLFLIESEILKTTSSKDDLNYFLIAESIIEIENNFYSLFETTNFKKDYSHNLPFYSSFIISKKNKAVLKTKFDGRLEIPKFWETFREDYPEYFI